MIKRSITVIGLLMAGMQMASADVDARVDWARRVELGMAVSGVVKQVPVEAGMRVKKGELLLELEQTPFTTAVTEARAVLAQATGARKEARRDHMQTSELYDRGLISMVELENATLKKESAEAAYAGAQARLLRAKYELSRSQLRAPFDGLVLSKRVDAGRTLISTQQAQTVLTFAAAGEYLARGLVSGKEIRDLSLGSSATVKVNGKTYTGNIIALGLEPVSGSKPDSPRYEISVRFQASDALLRAGAEAEIKL